MWVRGLCTTCNERSGKLFDRAYADFSIQVSRLMTPVARALTVIPGEAPAARFAPGLVARCVLYGMFAVNPRLRTIFPELARDLLSEKYPGEGRVSWPQQTALKLGCTHPFMPKSVVLSSGIWAIRVLNVRASHLSFADIVFPPLVWSLVVENDEAVSQMGLQITHALVDASDWVQYGPDRTHVDLRSLTRRLPAIALPLLSDQSDWIEMMGGEDGDADAVVVFGRTP